MILASSHGSRLFPLTTGGGQDTSSVPKHLLPVAGISPLARLLHTLHAFPQIVVTISFDDVKTVDFIREVATFRRTTADGTDDAVTNIDRDDKGPDNVWEFESKIVPGQPIYVVQLSQDCFGSVDALRQVEMTKIIHPSTRIVVFPGDVVFMTSPDETTQLLDPLMRPRASSSTSASHGVGGRNDDIEDEIACTLLLVDVLELDEHDVPLKESAKVSMIGMTPSTH